MSCSRQPGRSGWQRYLGELENDESLPAMPNEHVTVDMAFAFSQMGLWIFGVLMSEGACTYPTCCLLLAPVDLLYPPLTKAWN